MHPPNGCICIECSTGRRAFTPGGPLESSTAKLNKPDLNLQDNPGFRFPRISAALRQVRQGATRRASVASPPFEACRIGFRFGNAKCSAPETQQLRPVNNN
jgi:hypothetical protein